MILAAARKIMASQRDGSSASDSWRRTARKSAQTTVPLPEFSGRYVTIGCDGDSGSPTLREIGQARHQFSAASLINQERPPAVPFTHVVL
jgi:hypothetical protein